MNITGSRDGKIFFIDEDKVMVDGKMYYEKSSQNLPKADAYSLLADLRDAYEDLLIEAMNLYQYYPNNFRKTAEEYFKKEIELKKKLSEHYKNYK